MKTAYSKVVWTVGLMGISAAALAGEPKTTPPQEPAGFITGGVIGGFAAGPVGAVIGRVSAPGLATECIEPGRQPRRSPGGGAADR